MLLTPGPSRLSIFERLLTVWVGLCIIVGVALGHLMPGTFAVISGWEVANVNLPVAVLIWLMIVPMLFSSQVTPTFGSALATASRK